jgi:hypothetical protein
MTLWEVRKRFIEEFTGRYDLIIEGSDFADNGADFYIQAGQRWLERRISHKKSPASVYATLEIGGFYVIFPDARAVLEVWSSTSTTGRVELRKLSQREARELYPNDYAQIESGDPRYYYPVNFRSSPGSSLSFTIDQIGDIIYTSSLGGDYNYNGIIILPPVNLVRTIEVVGLFFLPRLASDSDANFWTENEPSLLLQSAARMHEIAMRNSQGVNDYTSAMSEALIDLDKDFVEEEITGVDQMEG